MLKEKVDTQKFFQIYSHNFYSTPTLIFKTIKKFYHVYIMLCINYYLIHIYDVFVADWTGLSEIQIFD